MPEPTVGRIVHFHPTNPEAAKAKGQPYPALVKMDRVIMGESAEGTIFEGTARK